MYQLFCGHACRTAIVVKTPIAYKNWLQHTTKSELKISEKI